MNLLPIRSAVPAILALVLAVPILWAPNSASAQDHVFVVGMPYVDGEEKTSPEVKDLLGEAYARAGATATFRYLPMLRDVNDANGSTIDASAGRTKLAVRDKETFIQVATPLLKTTVVAYSTRSDLHPTSWADLRGLSIGYLRGDETTRTSLSDARIQAHVFSSLRCGFKGLRKGRIDAFVTHSTFVALADMTGETANLRQSVPLYAGFFYHSVNRKYADVADRLSKALNEMLHDGTSRRIMGRFAGLLPDATNATAAIE